MGKRGAPIGNKNGTKQKRLVGDMLRRVAAQNPDKLRKACERLLDQAVEGDVMAFREFTDRTDGKAIQPLQGPGDGGEHLVHHLVEQIIVDAKD